MQINYSYFNSKKNCKTKMNRNRNLAKNIRPQILVLQQMKFQLETET